MAVSNQQTFYFFLFPMSLVLFDESDGTIVTSLSFHTTFPIDPPHYSVFQKTIGALADEQPLYREILAAMVMQTMQEQIPYHLDGFLAAHPEYPQAELRVQVTGAISVTGEACLVREDIQVGDLFRQL
jgi:hypothetical protein